MFSCNACWTYGRWTTRTFVLYFWQVTTTKWKVQFFSNECVSSKVTDSTPGFYWWMCSRTKWERSTTLYARRSCNVWELTAWHHGNSVKVCRRIEQQIDNYSANKYSDIWSINDNIKQFWNSSVCVRNIQNACLEHWLYWFIYWLLAAIISRLGEYETMSMWYELFYTWFEIFLNSNRGYFDVYFSNETDIYLLLYRSQ